METIQMNNPKRKGLMKWQQRLGYGVSDLACNLIWQMISLYLLYFYTDIMHLNAAAISLMFVVTRFVDGITDLLVGYLIDHTNTRWGKSRPYFLLVRYLLLFLLFFVSMSRTFLLLESWYMPILLILVYHWPIL